MVGLGLVCVLGKERGQEGLVGVVFRTVNMAAGSVHDSRCLPFALGQKGRRDEGKKGKGGRDSYGEE